MSENHHAERAVTGAPHGTTPEPVAPSALIGESPSTTALRTTIHAMAIRSGSVLVRGESGTGKELVAKLAHDWSRRSTGPFVAVDCTTLRDTLFESQLFGHVKGAFTGADRATLGFVRSADGGTLFLDEIGELDLAVQAKLLRCLQERVVTPLGATEPIPVDVRIVAATHRNLAAMVAQGKFRADLFYRLKVLTVEVPALRERIGDIPLLADHFLARCATLYQEPRRRLTSDALATLMRYAWPGNIRELGNCMEYAHAMARTAAIESADLPPEINAVAAQAVAAESHGLPTLRDSERMLIQRAIAASNANKTLAAKMLGVDRRQLYRLLDQHQISVIA